MLARKLVVKSKEQLAPIGELEMIQSLGIGQVHTRAPAVLEITRVVVTPDVVARHANLQPIAREGVIDTHGVEPAIELCAVVVEAKLLLHR